MQAVIPSNGARPLKRYLQHELETRIGRALIAGTIQEASTIRVDVQNGEFVVVHTEKERMEVVKAA